jgi:Tol biopolymer transport system component
MQSRTNSMCRLTLLVVPSLAVLVYIMVTARPVQATFPGTNGQIAFTRGNLFNGIPAFVFTAKPDGSNQQLVPLGDPVELFSMAVWSPDGTKLLISHTSRLDSAGQCCLPFRPAIVSPDGSGYTLLTIPDGPPDMDCTAWLNQTRILCGFGDQNAGIFSLRASDGGGPVRLTTNPYAATGGFDTPTDISPDGTRFVFLRFKSGLGPSSTPLPDQQVALFVENVSGTGLRQITPFLSAERPSANWSPDGLKIITNMSNGAGGSANRLFIVDPDGGGVTPISLKAGTQQYSAFQPVWSPDGTRIIFCMFINGGEGIFTANPDGSGVKQVKFTMDLTKVFNGPNWGTHPLQ